MKEEIQKVLGDETYTSNEERVEAIAKSLATLVIPKDKYNELNNKLKATETNYSTLSNEYNEFKQSKMTEDEKKQAELENFENEKKANARTKSELGVEKLLLKNGIEIKDDDVDLKETLQEIISEDYDKSIKLANSFVSLLNKTKVNTEKETTTKLLGETPKPIGGVTSSSNVSRIDQLNQQYQEAIKSKDVVRQTQLMTEIFNEQHKQTI